MWRFMPYILKSLWRHRARTFLTVSGTAVALFVFTFVGAVQQGMAQLTKNQEAERTLIVFQAGRFCPSTSRLQEDFARDLVPEKIPGVRDAIPIRVFMNNCRASLDLVVFHGMPAAKLRDARDLELLSGSWADYEQRANGALVGQALARRRNLAVGDTFTIGEVTVAICGVFRSEQPSDEHFLYTHLLFLQEARGMNARGTVTQIEVKLADGADPREVCRAIDEHFQNRTKTRSKGVFQARAVGDLAELIGFAHFLGFACVGLVLALVATTTVMAVHDRIREHAVLQTLGFTGQRIFGLIMIESLLISVAGGTLGVSLALAMLGLGDWAVGAEGVTIAFLPSLQLAWLGIAVTALTGVVAGLYPAWRAARAEIVPSLRYV